MTVKELSELLKKYPEDTKILVQGYEGGFSEISQLKYVGVKFDFYSEEWNGPHEIDESQKNKCVVILRQNS